MPDSRYSSTEFFRVHGAPGCGFSSVNHFIEVVSICRKGALARGPFRG